jgi:aryl-alcohol dehydrogenase-like predicted oxidoreductase
MSDRNKGISRRDFFKASAAAGAGALAAAAPAQAAPSTIPLRPFGRTGVKVPILSLGGIFDTSHNQLVMRQAIRLGVTYWDTAERYGYGRSETGMGEFFAKNPGSRQRVFLVSKGMSREPSELTGALDKSLKRLQTNYLDLYFIHAVDEISEMTPALKDWAAKAKASGKIKLFGFSTHSNMAKCLAGAAKLGWIDGIMFTYNFRIINDPNMKRAVEACHRAGIGLTAMKTQGRRSFLSGGSGQVDPRMLARFTQLGFTPEQAKLKVIWEDRRIASICSAMYDLTVLGANVAAALNKTRLSAADKGLLAAHAAETARSYCAGCGQICQTAVGGAAPVAEVMRHLMYYQEYGDRDLARECFGEIPPEIRGRLATVDYGPAEAACPQGMPVGRLMREAVELLTV